MKTLGVNSTGDTMWLACAENGVVSAAEPIRLGLPSGLESGQKLAALLDDSERTLRSTKAEAVVILEPENLAKFTFASSRRRVTGETLLALAAARLDISCVIMSRARLRAKLGLAKSGKLVDHVSSIVAEPLSPHWKSKRDLAALAALAGQGGSDAEG